MIKEERIHVLAQNQIYEGRLQPSRICEEEMNRILTNMIRAALQAERKCRKFKTGESEWSPVVAKARAAAQYWEMAIKVLKGGKLNTREMNQQQKNGSDGIQTRLQTEIY